ncbi:MAG TPA: farnesyl diphosphate synthase [Terriglobia bacterium]|nr:farnesyl diphosphate synthase [Terriglobia bacterium]
MSPSTTVAQYLDEQRALVDQELDRMLPPEDTYPHSIHQAMRYSVFAGGKRLRPILCAEAGRLLGADGPSLLRIASALELVHTYSLIHDDLPALDNDDLRRGKPTCHRAFGESTAILTGDALLTLAYEVLAEPDLASAECQLRIIRELAHATGTRNGMVAGQVMDLEAANQAVDAGTLEFIHSSKTGAFLCAAVRCGAIFAGAEESDLDRLTTYGQKIGLAFQIVDDLLDVLGSSATLGKTPGKDDDQRKATYPALYGIEESRRKAALLIQEACEILEPYGKAAGRLQELAHFLIERSA